MSLLKLTWVNYSSSPHLPLRQGHNALSIFPPAPFFLIYAKLRMKLEQDFLIYDGNTFVVTISFQSILYAISDDWCNSFNLFLNLATLRREIEVVYTMAFLVMKKIPGIFLYLNNFKHLYVLRSLHQNTWVLVYRQISKYKTYLIPTTDTKLISTTRLLGFWNVDLL